MKIPWKKRTSTSANSRPPKATTLAIQVLEPQGQGKAVVTTTEETLTMTLPDQNAKAAASNKQVKKKETVLVHSNDKSGSAVTMKQRQVSNSSSEVVAKKDETILGQQHTTTTTTTPQKKPTTPAPSSQLSNSSPTSHLELDILNATHQNLDFVRLQKSYSTSLMDEDNSISSEDDLLNNKEKEEQQQQQGVVEGGEEKEGAACTTSGCIDVTKDVKDGFSELVNELKTTTNQTTGEELPEFVNQVLSPMANFTDYMFCRMESELPDVVEEVNEFLSNDLHHLIFNTEEERGEGGGGNNQGEEEDGAGELEAVEEEEEEEEESVVENEEEGGVEEKQGEGVETAWGPRPEGNGGGQKQGETKRVAGGQTNKQGGGGGDNGQDNVNEEGGNEVLVVDGQDDSTEVIEAVLGRGEWEEVMQTRHECASYSPATGFLLRKDGRPEPSHDQVLVRVDATTISTRDCFETRRRDNTVELIEELWVPGHEIVGHVVRTGSGVDAEFLLGKRIAALLPYGGGCSQYACIHAKDAIVLPDEADSYEVAALLSMYMAAFQCLESVVGSDSKAGGSVSEDLDETMSVADSVVDEEEEADDAESMKEEEEEDVERESEAGEDNALNEEDVDDDKSGGGEIVGPEEEDDTESKGDDDVKLEGSTIGSRSEENIEEEGTKDEGDGEVESKGEEGSMRMSEADVESEKEDVESKKEDYIRVVDPKEEDVYTGCSCTPICLSSTEAEEVKKVDLNEDNDAVDDISLLAEDEGQKKSPLFGMKVLVVGAGSPVGLALVDLARNAGAFVHALSERSHLSAIRELGAKSWYELSQRAKWEAAWRSDMDLVIDTIGDSDYNPSFYTVLTTRGRLIRVNTTSCGKKYEPLRTKEGGLKNRLKNRLNRHDYKQRVINDKTVDDYNIFNSCEEEKELFEEDLAYLQDLLQVGKIAPKIFSRVGFDQLEGEWDKLVTAEGITGVLVVSPWKVGFTKID